MIEWLRVPPSDPAIALAGRTVPIHLTRHPRARRLTMRLAPDGTAVRITLPRWCRRADALAFAVARKAWLETQLEAVVPRADPFERGTLRYRGEQIALHWRPDAPRRPVPAERSLTLGGPRETVTNRLRRWLEEEGLRLSRDDLADYCARAGQTQPHLRLSRAARRWGSCSSKNVVRINWRLVMAPDFVRRSVVAHEVAHLVHFDHGARFHALLEDLYEGAIADADAWLRTHGRTLYADFG
ncbi:M48 family metallopeptidase [Qipengyuania sediminis]|uniref:M48 family metallopeptidase n=1 Tax=Qipengyuania sediminis TaxID=1532023 RepID=UPI001059732E|nr:M48 family metallopeptidase [Qipengyuania sediminis]